ncbi:MAG: DUF4340 domain-containing protein [Gemmatimonadetes bacterium]|nr:DUF4340 domain-containing protein [Gemmatimonadota bacterium]
MSKRTLKRLALVLGALVIVWGTAMLLGQRDPGAEPGGDLAAALAALASDSLESATLRGTGNETIELRNTGGLWTVNGFAADSGAVARLRSALSDARIGGLVARNASNHQRLGVTTETALTVELRGSAGAHTLLVGESGPRYPGSYVRLPDDDAVYEVLGDLRNALLRDVSAWRDRSIVRVDTAAIASLVIARDRQALTLVRRDSAWYAADVPGAAADSATVAAILGELARFDATGFAPDSAFTGSDERRVIATNAAGDTLADVVFTGQESNWHARARGSTEVFVVAGYRVDRIAPTRDALVRQ